MTLWLTVIAGVISMIVGIWKYSGRKARERRERIEKAKALFKEGISEEDPSKITAGLDRIHNS